MGQRVRYPSSSQKRINSHLFSSATHARSHPASPVAFKCDPPVHRWRLNVRVGDRCFCGMSVKTAEA